MNYVWLTICQTSLQLYVAIYQHMLASTYSAISYLTVVLLQLPQVYNIQQQANLCWLWLYACMYEDMINRWSVIIPCMHSCLPTARNFKSKISVLLLMSNLFWNMYMKSFITGAIYFKFIKFGLNTKFYFHNLYTGW